MSSNNYIAIMAGGVGSRFWPASRETMPKQFLDIPGDGESLLQKTVKRALLTVPLSNVLIVSNQQYKALIQEQLPELPVENILLEPSRNNTAPCVAYTALHLHAINPEAVFAVVPADHIIKKEDVYADAIARAFQKAAAEPVIVTLGITPTRPDTGYGYIQYDASADQHGICQVKCFKEKPDQPTAESYIATGEYVWNAGIFVWSTQTILANFERSAAQITKVLSQDLTKYATAEEQEYINSVYPQTDSISVDYAILEHADNVYTIPVDIGWSDLGTWNSLYSFLEKDDQSNVCQAQSDINGSTGNMIRVSNDKKLIVIDGLQDYIVIDEDDVLLIYPRSKEQEIKQVRSKYKDSTFA